MNFSKILISTAVCTVLLAAASVARAGCVYNGDTHTYDCSDVGVDTTDDLINQSIPSDVIDSSTSIPGNVMDNIIDQQVERIETSIPEAVSAPVSGPGTSISGAGAAGTEDDAFQGGR